MNWTINKRRPPQSLLAALVAVVLCVFTNLGWAQPTPARSGAVPTATVSQAAACGHWEQPISFSLPTTRRVSVGRLAEILLEDPAPAQTAAAIGAPELPFPRLVARSSASLHGTTVASVVRAVYAGSDTALRTAVTARIVEIFRTAGRDRIVIDEARRVCELVDPFTSAKTYVAPVNGVCPDGRPPRAQSRSRYLQAAPFRGDFYTESFPLGADRSDWRGSNSYSFRVMLKAGARPYTVSAARVYDAQHHPRPAARLCERVPSIIAADVPETADGKQNIFSELGALIGAVTSEGDLTAAQWASALFAGTIGPRLAGIDALRGCEDREANLRADLARSRDTTARVRATLTRADKRIDYWRTASIALIVLLLIAIIALIGVAGSKRPIIVARDSTLPLDGTHRDSMNPAPAPAAAAEQAPEPQVVMTRVIDAPLAAEVRELCVAIRARAGVKAPSDDSLAAEVAAANGAWNMLNDKTARGEDGKFLTKDGLIEALENAKKVGRDSRDGEVKALQAELDGWKAVKPTYVGMDRRIWLRSHDDMPAMFSPTDLAFVGQVEVALGLIIDEADDKTAKANRWDYVVDRVKTRFLKAGILKPGGVVDEKMLLRGLAVIDDERMKYRVRTDKLNHDIELMRKVLRELFAFAKWAISKPDLTMTEVVAKGREVVRSYEASGKKTGKFVAARAPVAAPPTVAAPSPAVELVSAAPDTVESPVAQPDVPAADDPHGETQVLQPPAALTAAEATAAARADNDKAATRPVEKAGYEPVAEVLSQPSGPEGDAATRALALATDSLPPVADEAPTQVVERPDLRPKTPLYVGEPANAVASAMFPTPATDAPGVSMADATRADGTPQPPPEAAPAPTAVVKLTQSITPFGPNFAPATSPRERPSDPAVPVTAPPGDARVESGVVQVSGERSHEESPARPEEPAWDPDGKLAEG